MKVIKLSKYFEYINPEYNYFKLTPTKSIRNNNTEQITIACATFFKELKQRVRKEDKKRWITRQSKVLYYVYLEKKKIEFYFILPKDYRAILLDKIGNCWKGITVSEIQYEELPQFAQESVAYAVSYKYKEFMSASTDMTNNYLLASICNTINVMSDDDKCGVMINISGIERNKMTCWKYQYEDMVEKFKNGGDIENRLSKGGIVKGITKVVFIICNVLSWIVSEALQTEEPPKKKDIITRDLSNSTKNKKISTIVNTQIAVLSESKDEKRALQNAVSLCQSFDVLREDNEFIFSRLSKKPNLIDSTFEEAETMIMSTKEAGKLLELPGRELIEQYHIECIKTNETTVPEILQKGFHCLGENIYKGNAVNAYLPTDFDKAALPVLLNGEQGSGKSVFIANLIHSVQSQNESAFVIDYIDKCQLANSIIKVSDPNKTIVLDMSNFDDLQAFSYNEIQPKSESIDDILDCINRKALCIETLINALNSNTADPLSSVMCDILNAASNIVFTKPEASLRDVVRCLTEYNYRHECINNIPSKLREEMQDYVNTLLSIDMFDKYGKNPDTKISKIDGIISRISMLKRDVRLKKMFKLSDTNNINFVDIMDQNKTLIIKMPQEFFQSTYIRDVLTCFIFTKIWQATIVRAARVPDGVHPDMCTVCIDEPFQCPALLELLNRDENLPQLRKFGLRFVISTQHIDQIKVIATTFNSAGSNYMFLKGTNKRDFESMSDYLNPYTYEDIVNLAQYSSLNLINTTKGRFPFITKLPKPLK